MHWHYGVIRHRNGTDEYFDIHEIYTDGTNISWTREPIAPFAESLDELKDMLRKMLDDIEKHGVVRTEDKFEKGGAD